MPTKFWLPQACILSICVFSFANEETMPRACASARMLVERVPQVGITVSCRWRNRSPQTRFLRLGL